MSKVLLLLSMASLVCAADDPWAKVKELKTGTEVRIYKTNGKQPIVAKMDELGDDSLIVVVKNEQTAIPKDQIERVDARPAVKGSRVTKESRITTDTPQPQPVGPQPTPGRPDVPGTSSSSGLSVGSKPDFETVYRRSATLPPPK